MYSIKYQNFSIIENNENLFFIIGSLLRYIYMYSFKYQNFFIIENNENLFYIIGSLLRTYTCIQLNIKTSLLLKTMKIYFTLLAHS